MRSMKSSLAANFLVDQSVNESLFPATWPLYFTVLRTRCLQDSACTSRCSASLPLVSLDDDNKLYVASPILPACSNPYISCTALRLRCHPAVSGRHEAYHRHHKEIAVLGRRNSERCVPIFGSEFHPGDTPAERYK